MKDSLGAISLLLLLGCSAAPAARHEKPESEAIHPLIGNEIGLDHALLWSSDNLAAEKRLEQLGFTLSQKAGSYGAGISNKFVWFKNRSFIEFLWLSDPAKTKVEAPKEYAFVTSYGGSNAFGVSVADADQTYVELNKAGLEPEKPGAEAWDPDGPDGPKKPIVNEWRFMFLKEGSLPGNPFFVQYTLSADAPVTKTHPNGAQKLSAVWVVVRDLKRAKAKYQRAQFVEASSFTSLGAKAVSLSAGQGEIFLVQPEKDGAFSASLKARGDHVHGISVQVADLDLTAKLLKQQFNGIMSTSAGRFGRSIVVPAQPPLGVMIEFHD